MFSTSCPISSGVWSGSSTTVPISRQNLACMRTEGMGERRLLSIADQDQLRSILKFMLDEREFLSPYGIRALSQFHRDNPYKLTRQRHGASRGL